METVVLEYGDRQARWEATLEGCVVEIARQLGDDSRLLIDTHEFASPRQAREFVADETSRLLAAGFVASRTGAGTARNHHGSASADAWASPVEGILGQLDSIAPTEQSRQSNPELLALIRGDPENVESYLVYADWLQERGEPRGHLIALHHGARRNPILHLAAEKLVERFASHLLPAAENPFQCDWRLGFLDALECDDRDLRAFLTHPCTAVLRQLGCGMEAFAANAEDADLPCLRLLELHGLEDAPVPEAESFLFDKLALSRLLSLRILSFVDLEGDGLPRLLEKLATEPAMASLEILAVQTDHVDDVQPIIAAFLSIPTDQRPALYIDLGDPGWNADVADRLRGEFDVVKTIPSPFLASGERCLDEDGDEQADLLDRICDRCQRMASGNDGRCGHCGGAVQVYDEEYGWLYDDEGDDDVDHGPGNRAAGEEVCAHDAARDPNFDPADDPDGGVDTRWDAFKDDAFDIDETAHDS